MTTDQFIPQSVGAGSVVTTAFVRGQGNWARRWGRLQPVHPSSLVVAEARASMYASDPAGVAYDPATTTWIRTVITADPSVSNEGELRGGWMAVPIVQPAGYTVRNARNLGPPVGISQAGPSNALVAPFAPSYSTTGFVRSSNGLYTPLDNSGAYHWGPWNTDALCIQQSGSLSADHPDRTTHKPVLTSYGPHLSGAAAFIAGGNLNAHPGFRSVRVVSQWADNVYQGPPGYAYKATSCTLTITLGGATITATIARASLTYDATFNIWRYDTGNLGALLMPTVGDVGTLAWSGSVTFTGPSNWPGGIANYVYLCPRVDIPAAFTATMGQDAAAGGIIAGSVPGF